jgi:hypothetical protein
MHSSAEPLPFRSILPKSKFIFAFRDPRSAVVSQYFFYKSYPLQNLWTSPPGIINPLGTLSYHLCRNLRDFLEDVMGNDGYARDRADEFGTRDLTKKALLDEIQVTSAAVDHALDTLVPDRLSSLMPDTAPQHKGKTIGFFLVQLCCHLSRHRGQLNYLRRILAGRTEV